MTDRVAGYPIDPLFLERWSPRAFDGSAVPEADLLAMLEAARWAPSAFNAQPWRMLYALSGGADWARFLGLLVPNNQSWAKHAGALVFFVSDTLMGTGDKMQPSYTHSFDTGSAWLQLALQATRMGYHAHGMSGVDFARAQSELGVPERFRVEAAAAIGRMGDPATLPEPLRAREAPSDRKPLAELAYPGSFRA